MVVESLLSWFYLDTVVLGAATQSKVGSGPENYHFLFVLRQKSFNNFHSLVNQGSDL